MILVKSKTINLKINYSASNILITLLQYYDYAIMENEFSLQIELYEYQFGCQLHSCVIEIWESCKARAYFN